MKSFEFEKRELQMEVRAAAQVLADEERVQSPLEANVGRRQTRRTSADDHDIMH